MKTEELIQHLGDDLRPVSPLPAPWRRAALWLAGGGVYLLTFVVVAWIRRGTLGIVANDGAYVVQQLALVATAMVASLAAFASVIPATHTRVVVAPLLSGLVVMAALLWSCVADVLRQGTLGWGRETDWPCVVSIAIGSLVLWLGAMVMLRRGAPLTPRLSGLLAGVAALSVVNIEACVTRPHRFGLTVLVWHGMTTALMLVALAQSGRGVLRWKRANPG
jgi:hypothetical protein